MRVKQNHNGDVGEKGKGTPVAFIMKSYKNHAAYATLYFPTSLGLFCILSPVNCHFCLEC